MKDIIYVDFKLKVGYLLVPVMQLRNGLPACLLASNLARKPPKLRRYMNLGPPAHIRFSQTDNILQGQEIIMTTLSRLVMRVIVNFIILYGFSVRQLFWSPAKCSLCVYVCAFLCQINSTNSKHTAAIILDALKWNSVVFVFFYRNEVRQWKVAEIDRARTRVRLIDHFND